MSGCLEERLSRLALFILSAGSGSFLTNPGDQNYIHVNPSALADNGVRIATDGDVDERDAVSTYTDRGDWLLAGGTASDYEVQATLSSGDTPTGTLGSYLALSTNREWYLDTNGGFETCVLAITIRRIANTSDSISFNVTLTADGTPL